LTTFNQASKEDKDKKGAEEEINIDEMLNDLRRDIIRVYKETIEKHADLHAKATIDILTVSIMKKSMFDKLRTE
jgi:hypothetical protein